MSSSSQPNEKGKTNVTMARARTYTTVGTVLPANLRDKLAQHQADSIKDKEEKGKEISDGMIENEAHIKNNSKNNSFQNREVGKISINLHNRQKESQQLQLHKTSPVAKKHGIYPALTLTSGNSKLCECDKTYLKNTFCQPPYPDLNFHDRFYRCSVCHSRPATRVCCKTWTPFCEKHAAEFYKANKDNHVFINYEIWQYDDCFWCYRCNTFCRCEAFDNVLEMLYLSKGSYVNEPVSDKHLDYFEYNGVRVGTGTMQGWRSDNEDAHVVYLGLPISGHDYFAIFDGHGGPLVARYAARKTHELYDRLWKECHGVVTNALTKAFLQTDEELNKETSSDESGSTGCTANVVVVCHNTKKIYCANAGDARSILCRKNEAIQLSEDHRPNVQSERARILAAGSMISEDERIEGLLAVSRAFGDFDFKQASALPPAKQAVTAMPDVTVNELTEDDHFIVCACDGIWDCVTSQECVDFVLDQLKHNVKDPRKIIEKLFDRCLPKDIPEDGIGTDNMSAILVFLK